MKKKKSCAKSILYKNGSKTTLSVIINYNGKEYLSTYQLLNARGEMWVGFDKTTLMPNICEDELSSKDRQKIYREIWNFARRNNL